MSCPIFLRFWCNGSLVTWKVVNVSICSQVSDCYVLDAVSIVAKSASWPHVRLSACNRAAPTGLIFVKLGMIFYYENFWWNARFGENRAKMSCTWHEDLSTFYWRWHSVAIKGLFLSEIVSCCYGCRGGTNITGTCHNVTLFVHNLSGLCSVSPCTVFRTYSLSCSVWLHLATCVN
jgi:hypothetical protein